MRDIVVIGGGIAGVSAALYAARTNVSLLLVEGGNIGGQLSYIASVENYPGLPPVSGYDLIQNLNAHLNHFSIEVMSKKVTALRIQDDRFYVGLENGGIPCRSVIVATGARPQELGVPGETALTGKGISYCAVCDGFFFKQKTIAVVGGGNTALEEALYLARIAKKVFVIHRRDAFRGFPALAEKVRNTPNIEILWNTTVEECRGKDFLEEAVVKNTRTGIVSTVALQGLFIAVGYVPQTGFLPENVNRDGKGFIVTDGNYATSVAGIYACGDCRQRPLKQLITAAAEGAQAAMSAYAFLTDHQT